MKKFLGKFTTQIILLFAVLQTTIIFFAPIGPHLDEGIFALAGLRAWQGYGLSDYYLNWFAGTPFFWSFFSGAGYAWFGFAGSRLFALAFVLMALIFFAQATSNLFGESVAEWATLALCLNGLFIFQAHFATHDAPALAALAGALWAITQVAKENKLRWLLAAAILFGLATIIKYGTVFAFPILVSLLFSQLKTKRFETLSLFTGIAAILFFGYSFIAFQRLIPPAFQAYAQSSTQFRGFNEVLAREGYFILLPLLLGALGLRVAWRTPQRGVSIILFGGLFVFPAIHLGSLTIASDYKHVLIGFLFVYMLIGVALEQLWQASRKTVWVLAMVVVFGWGAFQSYQSDHARTDIRPALNYLLQNMKLGETFAADKAWAYAPEFYRRGLITSPAQIYDGDALQHRRINTCEVDWLVGEVNGVTYLSDDLVKIAAACDYKQEFVYATPVLELIPPFQRDALLVIYHKQKPAPEFWQPAKPAPFISYEGQKAVINGKLYVMGGYYTGQLQVTREAEIYDPQRNTWSRLPDLPEAVSHAGTATDGQFIYIAGGRLGDGTLPPASDHVWKFDLQTLNWSRLPPLPAPRDAGGLVLLQRQLHYLGGGTHIESSLMILDAPDHWVLDLDQPTQWRAAPPLPTARNHLGVIALADKIYVLGGGVSPDDYVGPVRTVERYDPITTQWETLAPLPKPVGHIAASVFTACGKIFVVGGVTNHGRLNLSDVYSYDPQTNHWDTFFSLPQPRHSIVADYVDGWFVAVGGDGPGGFGFVNWATPYNCP